MDVMSEKSPAKLTEQLYGVLLENMAEGFVICEAIRDADGRLVDYRFKYLSPTFARRTPERLAALGRRQMELRPRTPASWMTACHRALVTGRISFEYQEPDDGRWYEITMVRISDHEFAQFFVDITDRKLAEQHRDQLFHELNHRVKNNLALVSAMLELQARQSDGSGREALMTAVDRIRAIADLHDALQCEGRSDDVELCPYLETLGHRLAESLFAAGGGRVDLVCPAVRLRTNAAVNLGLILNELVTNSAKHGAAGRPSVAIRIDVEATEREVRIVVRDDGPGFPGGEAPTSRRLGWRLVRSLARTIGAEVRILPGPGANVELRLPREADTG